ncbi:helix-turn-helix domain-containing protein [Planococcus dechangensis]|uniref:Helix-turn-helix domain-containing protein n=1 Tax=Planococcus dechangensis TaxID=1176255 RepID=A0ABV9MG46_9BACL
MFQIQIDENALKQLYLSKIEERLESIEQEVFFFSSKELCHYLGMSWNTIVNNLLIDEDFPHLRVGSRWIFPVQEVKEYMKVYTGEVKKNGGDVLRYRRTKK